MTSFTYSLYAQVGGLDPILRFCRRWHALCLDYAIAAHPFEHAREPQRPELLAAYIAEALGGPPLYSGGGADHSFVQRFHAGKGPHVALDEACLHLLDRAVSETGVATNVAEEISRWLRAAIEAQRQMGS